MSKPLHPPLNLGSDVIAKKIEHKHLDMILDENLDFKSHIREAFAKVKRKIRMIKFLSKYVSRHVLDQINKLYTRPNPDYGDIIYHRNDPHMSFDVTKRFEQTQYSTTLAIIGAWRGTSRQRLHDELGWENLHDRRWFTISLTCGKAIFWRNYLLKFLMLAKFRILLEVQMNKNQ